jgi:hypothetical protein
MKFGEQREATDGGVRKVYTGVENFRVIAINPNHTKLKELYGENAKEEEYIGENEINGQKYPQLRIVVHCDNNPEEGEPKVTCRPTFWVTKAPVESQTGKKQYINVFGNTIWLTDEQGAMNVPFHENVGPNGTYKFDATGKRLALRGEEEFIQFFRALLNLPSPIKVNDPMEAASQFDISDWDKMFSKDFSMINSIVKNTNNKVGFLLGAKRVEDNVYQDVFTRAPLRQYQKGSKRFDYLLKDLDSSKEAGAYPNTDFGPRDCVLREYEPDATPTNTNAFAPQQPANTGSFFNPEAAASFAGSN